MSLSTDSVLAVRDPSVLSIQQPQVQELQIQNIQNWIKNIKTEVATQENYLDKLLLEIEMVKYVSAPITIKTIETETEVHTRKEKLLGKSWKCTLEIKSAKKEQIEEEGVKNILKDKMKQISSFIQDASCFNGQLKISAYGTQNQNLGEAILSLQNGSLPLFLESQKN